MVASPYEALAARQKAYQLEVGLHLSKPVKVNYRKGLISVYGQQ